jgi:hypothetical protein
VSKVSLFAAALEGLRKADKTLWTPYWESVFEVGPYTQRFLD